MSRKGRWFAAGLASLLACLACTEREPESASSLPFEEAFQLVEVVQLGEDATDSIAEIGIFVERQDGGFVIGDRFLSRVRSYASDGSLEAGFGRFGNGPWEFQGIHGVAVTAAGRVVVASARNSWLTYLNGDLSPDSMLALPGFFVTSLLPLGSDLVFFGMGRELRGYELHEQEGLFHRLTDGQVVWSSWTTPLYRKPYWGSFGSVTSAVAGDSLYVMTSLLYPATILNGAGDSIGSIGTPSNTFRRIPDIPRGYFAFTEGEAPSGNRMRDVVASYDLVERMDVVGGDHLVFTVGRPDQTSLPPGLRFIHSHVEVYNRHTGVKRFEDVTLPEGARVIGGGRYLYVLLNPDIPPWRLAKYRPLASAPLSGRAAASHLTTALRRVAAAVAPRMEPRR